MCAERTPCLYQAAVPKWFKLLLNASVWVVSVISSVVLVEAAEIYFTPSDDTYVDVLSPNTIFGDSDIISVYPNRPYNGQEAYFKFNLSGLTDPLVSASLEVTPIAVHGPAAEVFVSYYYGPSGSNFWSEEDYTYSDRLGRTKFTLRTLQISQADAIENQPVAFDVTTFFQALQELHGGSDLEITFILDQFGISHANANRVDFASKQHATLPAPKLRFTTIGGEEIIVAPTFMLDSLDVAVGSIDVNFTLDDGGEASDVMVHLGLTDQGDTHSWDHSLNFGPLDSGPYTSDLSAFAILPNHLYHFNLSASNSAGEGWLSGSNSFMTPARLPQFTLSGASNISSNTADLGFVVDSTGGETPDVTIFWGVNDGGNQPDNWTNSRDLGFVELGSYISPVTELLSDQLYYYTLAASNSAGVAWPTQSAAFTTASASSDGGDETDPDSDDGTDPSSETDGPETRQYFAIEDTYVASGLPTTIYGHFQKLWFQSENLSDESAVDNRKGVIKFDTSDIVNPDELAVERAELTLNIFDAPAGTAIDVFYSAYDDWDEYDLAWFQMGGFEPLIPVTTAPVSIPQAAQETVPLNIDITQFFLDNQNILDAALTFVIVQRDGDNQLVRIHTSNDGLPAGFELDLVPADTEPEEEGPEPEYVERTVSITNIADTYIQGTNPGGEGGPDDYADTVFGASGHIALKDRPSQPRITREGIVKFDLSVFDPDWEITKVELDLNVRSGSTSDSFDIFYAPYDDWHEVDNGSNSGLTWNIWKTAVPDSELEEVKSGVQFEGTSGPLSPIDITAFVLSQMESDPIVTFVLKQEAELNQFRSFYSKEHGDGLVGPKVTVTFLEELEPEPEPDPEYVTECSDVTAIDDLYVQLGQPNVGWGRDQELRMRTGNAYGGDERSREIFMKFNVSEFTEDEIHSGLLKLFCLNQLNGSVYFNVYYSLNDDWSDEGGTTWNTSRAIVPPGGLSDPTSAGGLTTEHLVAASVAVSDSDFESEITIDISEVLQNESVVGDGYLTLILVQHVQGNQYVTFASSDSHDFAGPTIEVCTVVEEEPPLLLECFDASAVNDTFVHIGTEYNKGSNREIVIRSSSGSANDDKYREAFIRFDLSELNQDFYSGLLKLQNISTFNTPGSTQHFSVYYGLDDNWTDQGPLAITWTPSRDLIPAGGLTDEYLVASGVAMTESDLEITVDITDVLKNASVVGDGFLTLILIPESDPGQYLEFSSIDSLTHTGPMIEICHVYDGADPLITQDPLYLVDNEQELIPVSQSVITTSYYDRGQPDFFGELPVKNFDPTGTQVVDIVDDEWISYHDNSAAGSSSFISFDLTEIDSERTILSAHLELKSKGLTSSSLGGPTVGEMTINLSNVNLADISPSEENIQISEYNSIVDGLTPRVSSPFDSSQDSSLSIEITDIVIEELGDAAADNQLDLALFPGGGSLHVASFHSYEGVVALAPKLIVEYEETSGLGLEDATPRERDVVLDISNEVPADYVPFGGVTAETFVDSQGNFNYILPIDVPAGINGMTPSLALTYNSGVKADGQLGKGWSLESGADRIALRKKNFIRDGKYSVDLMDSSAPAFSLNGVPLRLVTFEGQTFFTTDQDMHVRILPYGRYFEDDLDLLNSDTGTDVSLSAFQILKWEIEYSDGSRKIFTKRLAGQAEAPEEATLGFDTDYRMLSDEVTDVWLLTSEVDIHDNEISYQYEDGHYLKEIHYAYTDGVADSKVVINYLPNINYDTLDYNFVGKTHSVYREGKRYTPVEKYISQIEVSNNSRPWRTYNPEPIFEGPALVQMLHAISIHGHDDGLPTAADDVLIDRHEFTYHDHFVAEEGFEDTGVTVPLPIAGYQFDDAHGDFGERWFGSGTQVIDIDEDGLPDLFQYTEETDGMLLYLNTGNGFQPVSVESGSEYAKCIPPVRFGEFRYKERTKIDGLLNRHAYEEIYEFVRKASLIDMNGDARPDILNYDGKVYVNRGLGATPEGESMWVESPDFQIPMIQSEVRHDDDGIESDMRNNIYGGNYLFEDFNGDGLVDVYFGVLRAIDPEDGASIGGSEDDRFCIVQVHYNNIGLSVSNSDTRVWVPALPDRFVAAGGDSAYIYNDTIRFMSVDKKSNGSLRAGGDRAIFQYNDWADDPNIDISEVHLPPCMLTGNAFREYDNVSIGLMIDVDGDGLKDVVVGNAPHHQGDTSHIEPHWRKVYVNNGRGFELMRDDNGEPVKIPEPGLYGVYSQGPLDGVKTPILNATFADLNGDFLPEFITSPTSEGSTVHINTGNGWVEASEANNISSFNAAAIVDTGNAYDLGVRFVDLNMDGYPDQIQSFANQSSSGTAQNSKINYNRRILFSSDNFVSTYAVNSEYYENIGAVSFNYKPSLRRIIADYSRMIARSIFVPDFKDPMTYISLLSPGLFGIDTMMDVADAVDLSMQSRGMLEQSSSMSGGPQLYFDINGDGSPDSIYAPGRYYDVEHSCGWRPFVDHCYEEYTEFLESESSIAFNRRSSDFSNMIRIESKLNNIDVEYAPIISKDVQLTQIQPRGGNLHHAVHPVRSGLSVVKSITRDIAGELQPLDYYYGDGARMAGAGYVFGKMWTVDNIGKTVSYSELETEPDDRVFFGLTSRSANAVFGPNLDSITRRNENGSINEEDLKILVDFATSAPEDLITITRQDFFNEMWFPYPWGGSADDFDPVTHNPTNDNPESESERVKLSQPYFLTAGIFVQNFSPESGNSPISTADQIIVPNRFGAPFKVILTDDFTQELKDFSLSTYANIGHILDFSAAFSREVNTVEYSYNHLIGSGDQWIVNQPDIVQSTLAYWDSIAGDSVVQATIETAHTYDSGNKNLLSVKTGTDELYKITSFGGHDTYGNPGTITFSGSDPGDERVTEIRYFTSGDWAGRAVKSIIRKSELDFVTTVETVDPGTGQPTEIKDSNDNVTRIEYDIFGRQQKVLRPDGVMTINLVQEDNNEGDNIAYTTTSIASGPFYSKAAFDNVGRALKIWAPGPKWKGISSEGDATWSQVIIGYNRDGTLDGMSIPTKYRASEYDFGKTHFDDIASFYEYDHFGRIETAYGRAVTASSTYHYGRNSTTVVDPMDSTTTTQQLGHSAILTTNDNGGRVLNYRRPTETGWVEAIRTDADGDGILEQKTIIRNTYDIFGRRTLLDDPSFGIQEYSYNTFDELIGVLKNEGTEVETTITFDRDLLGRPRTITYDDGPLGKPTRQESYIYDKLGSQEHLGFRFVRSLSVGDTSADEPHMEIRIPDEFGRTEIVETTIIDTLGSGAEYTFRSGYDYDEIGRLQRRLNPQLPGEQPVIFDYYYSKNGTLEEIRDQDGSHILWQATEVNREGFVLSEQLGASVRTYHDPDLLGRLAKSRSFGSSPDNPLLLAQYGYRKDNFMESRTFGYSDNITSESFGYDGLKQLETVNFILQKADPEFEGYYFNEPTRELSYDYDDHSRMLYSDSLIRNDEDEVEVKRHHFDYGEHQTIE